MCVVFVRKADSPTRVPSYTEGFDVFVGKECPEKENKEEKISGGPGDEAVEFWGSTAKL